MADKEIKITFPEEKLEALSFFMKQNNEEIEAVLKAHLDKAYQKTVPALVRMYVDGRSQNDILETLPASDGVEESNNTQSPEGRQRRNQGSGTASRTTRRTPRNAEPVADTTAAEEQAEEVQEEEQEENSMVPLHLKTHTGIRGEILKKDRNGIAIML